MEKGIILSKYWEINFHLQKNNYYRLTRRKLKRLFCANFQRNQKKNYFT